jgi:hypothetical protein
MKISVRCKEVNTGAQINPLELVYLPLYNMDVASIG